MKLKKVTRSLLLASAAASVLAIARGNVMNSAGLGYLIWNLFLAWVPYMLSVYCIKHGAPLIRTIPLFLLWLLFFPNAPYLATDVMHIGLSWPTSHAGWYDSLVFFFFGWLGVIIGTVSLRAIDVFIREKTAAWKAELAIIGISIVASFGIYLGRFERWNSWDLLTRPLTILRHPYALSPTLGHAVSLLVFVPVFAAFIYSTYAIVRVLMSAEK